MKESGRILHTHKEKSQSFKAIKHSKDDPEDTEKASVQVEVIPSPDKIPVDASSLPLSPIDSALLHDCLRHKMTM